MAPVAAGILPAVEPGLQPGGENHKHIGTCQSRHKLPALGGIGTGRLEAALHVRQNA